MNDTITIFWFRQDLRLTDNPGLFEAAKRGLVMPIYILDNDNSNDFKIGSASKWWLYHSLHYLNESLEGKLNVYAGNSKKIITSLLRKNNVNAVYWNRCYEPWRIKEDAEISAYLQEKNIGCNFFNGSLLFEPEENLKKDGTPYKRYTPFCRKLFLKEIGLRYALPKPKKLYLIQDPNHVKTIDSLNLLSKKNWYKKMASHWHIGEKAAQKKLKTFLKDHLTGYSVDRNYPFKNTTSMLSPHLHFGEISPTQIWHSLTAIKKSDTKDGERFLNELLWREFSYHLLYHFPELPQKNLQSKFDQFSWESNPRWLSAWQKGQTGYPLIDAGMRELWETGYMHNRVRMIVASFLVKNLRLHWYYGEKWFWDCLVDADLANNSMNWQWVAGCGTDAAPYFRIFNPTTQAEKFDPNGFYVHQFVPELRKLAKPFLFKPWEAPEAVLKAAGIILGKTYPKPIVDFQVSRNQALQMYRTLKGSSG